MTVPGSLNGHVRRIFPGAFPAEFARYAFKLLTWAPALIFFNTHVAECAVITGASMFPYLNLEFNETIRRDICLVRKWRPLNNLQRGMIVIFRSPNDPEKTIVKRVVALEYETVNPRPPCPVPALEVPGGHVWVEGDNKDRRKTLDSNTYGPIAMNLIIGQITHVLFPWKSFGPVRWWEFKRGETSARA